MVCAIPLTEFTLKMGISLAKNVTLPAVLKARYGELGSHQLVPKHQTAVCHQTSVESWHTGGDGPPASRVPDGGSHCAGQVVFWNVCHGGLVFSPNKTYYLWHYRVNTSQKQYVLSVPWLPQSFLLRWWVMSMNHHFEEVFELPLVMEDKVEGYRKTKKVILFLNNVRLGMISKKSLSLCEWELAVKSEKQMT